MATQKLYAGAKLREMRTKLGLTQKDFAAKLGVSLPYLNQMENNNRPVSTTVVLALAQEFGLDVTELSTGDSERLVSDMREALADPVFADTMPPLADLRPLRRTVMNADFHMLEVEAIAESPLLMHNRHDVPVTVWVGGDERPAFLDQARWLCEAWTHAKLHVAPGRHHFDVIEDLELPDSPLTNALLDEI